MGTRYVIKSGDLYYTSLPFEAEGWSAKRSNAYVFEDVEGGWCSPEDADGNRGWAKAVVACIGRSDSPTPAPPAGKPRVVRLVRKPKAVA